MQEGEINLKEVIKIISKSKKFIFIFTLTMTTIAVIYINFKKSIPVYSGNVLIEIGEIKIKNNKAKYLDYRNDLEIILENRFEVEIIIPRKTKKLLKIFNENEDKKIIIENIKNTMNYILQRHKEKVKMYDNYIMTKQINTIEISDIPINKLKTELIILTTFLLSFSLSIIFIFFKNAKQSTKSRGF